MIETDKHIKMVAVKKLHCLRCDFEWFPRYQNKLPRTCANCGSPYWDVPRKVKKEKQATGKLNFPEVPCCKADQKKDK